MHMCNQPSPNTAKADQVIRTENGLSLLTYPGSLLTLYTSLTTFKFPKPTLGTSKLWGVGAFHYAKAMSWQRQKECFLLAYNSTCIERGGLRATNQQQTPGAAVWFRRSSLSTRRRNCGFNKGLAAHLVQRRIWVDFESSTTRDTIKAGWVLLSTRASPHQL